MLKAFPGGNLILSLKATSVVPEGCKPCKVRNPPDFVRFGAHVAEAGMKPGDCNPPIPELFDRLES